MIIIMIKYNNFLYQDFYMNINVKYNKCFRYYIKK